MGTVSRATRARHVELINELLPEIEAVARDTTKRYTIRERAIAVHMLVQQLLMLPRGAAIAEVAPDND